MNVIELQGVTKSFGKQTVLENLSLEVSEGKTLVIVGASGQGKSVVLKHMLGLVTPDSGKVMVLGKDVARLGRAELTEVRKNFGVLFQNAALLDSMNIFDNIALPLRERTRLSESKIAARVGELLEMMDLPDSSEKFPEQLSGGMKKRAGLARALALNPKIVFFDEPTTGLDILKANEVYRLFHKAQKELGYTAVIVSHDVPKIFKLADKVALLAECKIQVCLPPEQFQRSENPHVRSFVEITMGPVYSSSSEEV